MKNFYAQFDENADAPITQEHLDHCRNRKTAIEQKNKWIFIAHIAMGVLLFVLSMFLSAMVGRDPAVEGPNKWYVGVTLAAAQIIFAGAIIGFGFWAAMKRRIPTYVLMALFLAHLLYTLLAPYSYMELLLVPLDIAGIGLNYLRLPIIAEEEWLKKQPGYPYFSEAAIRSGEYELPLHITHRRPPSEDMDSVGGSTAEAQTSRQTDLPSVSAEDVGLADMTAEKPMFTTPEVKLPPPVTLRSDAALESLWEEAKPDSPAQEPAPTEPAVSPETMLADMTVPETRQTGGALPDPEEVKERLRRMAAQKQAQE